jgi:tetratricopeptide (TPR) repeat protein
MANYRGFKYFIQNYILPFGSLKLNYIKLKLVFFLFISVVYCNIVYSRSEKDSLLNELNKAINNSKSYDAEKLAGLQKIKEPFKSSKNYSLSSQYDFYRKLYEEYKIFRFDTAFVYAGKMQEIAFSFKDPVKVAQSRINILFVLVSAGMFKEAAELLNEIDITGQPDSIKANYFSLKARYYFDLADYVRDEFHAPGYNKSGNDNLDSALVLFPANSFESFYFNGLKNLKKGAMEKAFADFHTLLSWSDLTYHQTALVASTLSYVYIKRGETHNAIHYQMQAAIADIKSSTKETYAILSLAQLLFEQGDFKNASFYIEKAIDDATFYGARQRKVQVSTIMPIIQSSRINFIEGQRRSWIIYGAAVSGVLILLTFLIIIIYRQNRKLEHARRVISDAHIKLHNVNTKLQDVNSELQNVNFELHEVNSKLSEANKIKEEYIGYFFTINSGIVQKIERLKTLIEQKVRDRKLEDIRIIVNNINIHNEKQELLKSFDKAFLKLFPHFVEEFNSLFEEEDQIKLSDEELLTTDLRIYALKRLGIKESEKIAEILEYSVKSIYAYKTKIRNRSKLPKDEFDERIMRIKSL